MNFFNEKLSIIFRDTARRGNVYIASSAVARLIVFWFTLSFSGGTLPTLFTFRLHTQFFWMRRYTIQLPCCVISAGVSPSRLLHPSASPPFLNKDLYQTLWPLVPHHIKSNFWDFLRHKPSFNFNNSKRISHFNDRQHAYIPTISNIWILFIVTSHHLLNSDPSSSSPFCFHLTTFACCTPSLHAGDLLIPLSFCLSPFSVARQHIHMCSSFGIHSSQTCVYVVQQSTFSHVPSCTALLARGHMQLGSRVNTQSPLKTRLQWLETVLLRKIIYLQKGTPLYYRHRKSETIVTYTTHYITCNGFIRSHTTKIQNNFKLRHNET